jgi:hypothetical protein
MYRAFATVIVCGALALAASACGSSTKQSANSPSASSTASQQTPRGEAGAGALAADANSAATGDIPDTQVFLTYHNRAGGYSMSYPEGWAIKENGGNVTIAEKNNLLHVVVEKGATPSITSISAALQRLKKANKSLTFTVPSFVRLPAAPALEATYTTRSTPNPVTGKSVLLVVDRYELGHNGKVAVVDLGTPKGVDNVDAYRMIINSFRWK